MSSSEKQMQELSRLIKETGERIAENYYDAFFEFLAELGLFSDDPPPVPLKLWGVLAQAFADASGYRIVLQAEILRPNDAEPLCYRCVGHAEVAVADPTVFVEAAEE